MQHESNPVLESPDVPRSLWERWVLDFHNRTVLFRIGNWIVTTYTFLAGAAFAVGFSVSLWYSAMQGFSPNYLAHLYLLVLVPCIVLGLRGFCVMHEWRELLKHPLATLVKPGYMLHGGIAGGLVGLLLVSKLSGLPMLCLFDAAALALPIGEAIARLGCYVYGCCWGKPTRARFGARYTSPDSKVLRLAPHLHNVRLHPAQLYALVAYLGLFVVFLYTLPHLPFDGFLAGLYLVTHSLLRFVLERFREDDRNKLWRGFSHTNLYSTVMVLLGALCFWSGARAGKLTAPDLSLGFVDVLTRGSLAPWLTLYGCLFGLAYGVHYRKVGSWFTAQRACSIDGGDRL